MNIQNILNDSNQQVIIYGAGKFGKRVLRRFYENNLIEKVVCFAETKCKEKDLIIDGKPVYEFAQLKKFYQTALFVVSVSEQYYIQIMNLLKENKIKKIYDGRKLILDSFQIEESEIEARNLRHRQYLAAISQGENDNQIIASHVTYPLASNAGDTYLSWCVRKYLGFHHWNIINVADEVTLDTINEINKTDVLVIGGGGLFLPDTNINTKSGWQWAISEELLANIKVPIIVYSVGYNYFPGQIKSELFIKSINALVKKSAFFGLRNHGSIRAIKEIVDLKEKISFQPCITTIMRFILDNKIKNESRDSKKIALNMAFDRENRRYGKNQEEILNEVARVMKLIDVRGYKIYYVAHCDDDVRFVQYLERMKVNFVKVNLTQALPDEIIKFYNEIDLVIGMRGHAQMIPYGLGCKIITLGTHDKMRWFLEDIGMTEYYVDLRKMSGEVKEKIEKMVEGVMNDEGIDNKMEQSGKELLKISDHNRQEIYKILNMDK